MLLLSLRDVAHEIGAFDGHASERDAHHMPPSNLGHPLDAASAVAIVEDDNVGCLCGREWRTHAHTVPLRATRHTVAKRVLGDDLEGRTLADKGGAQPDTLGDAARGVDARSGRAHAQGRAARVGSAQRHRERVLACEQSVAISGNQWQSVSINGNQWQSSTESVYSPTSNQWHSVAIKH